MLKRVMCAAVLLFALTISAAAAETTVEYSGLEELVIKGNPTYTQAIKSISIEESRLKDLQSQMNSVTINSNADWTSAMSMSTKITTQENTIQSQKDALDTTLAQQLWQAQNLYLTHFTLSAKLEQQTKALKTLIAQRDETERKIALGSMARASLKSVDTQITAQEKAVTQAQKDLENNLGSLKTLLGLDGDIQIGDIPELDITSVPGRDCDTDLEQYLKNNQSLVSQRNKMKNMSDTHDYMSALLQLNKLTKEATDAFPAQYNTLQEKYKAWADLEKDMADKQAELAELQRQYELGSVARKKLTEKQKEIDTLEQNQYTGKIDMYQAMRRYENTLLGL